MVRPKNYTSFLSWREDESDDKGVFGLYRALLENRTISQNLSQGAFSFYNILRKRPGRPPFLLAQTAQLQIPILGDIEFGVITLIVFELPCNFSENILTPAHHVILWKNEKSAFEGHDDICSSFLWHFRSAGIESFQTIPIFKKSGENRHFR